MGWYYAGLHVDQHVHGGGSSEWVCCSIFFKVTAAALCSSGTQTQPNVLNRHPDTVTLIAACGMPHGCTVPWKAIVHSAHIPATRK